MHLNEYQAAAGRTARIFKNQGEQLKYAALSIAEEAGEIAQAIRKPLFHAAPFDEGKVLDELGDMLWFVAFAAGTLGMGLDEVASRNLAKLAERHGNAYRPAYYTGTEAAS